MLPYFPLPNFFGSSQFNYQIPIVSNQHIDSLQGRWNKGIGRKNQLNGGFGLSSSRSDNSQLDPDFSFLDTASSLGMQANISWRHSFTNRLSGYGELPVQPPIEHHCAVLREPDQRLWRCGDHRQQSGAAELGSAEPEFREHHRAGRRNQSVIP